MYSKSIRRAGGRIARAANVVVEALEQRQMLTVTFNPVNGVVKDTLFSSGTIFVSLAKKDPTTLCVWENGVRYAYPLAQVKRLNLLGMAGNDLIQVSEQYGAITLPTHLYSNTGNSTLVGGSGSTVLSGGDGSNHVYAGVGPAVICFGNGNNEVIGQGNDNIWIWGVGDNIINGGGSGSRITVGSGHNQINSQAAIEALAVGGTLNVGTNTNAGYQPTPSPLAFSPGQIYGAYQFPGITSIDDGTGQTMVFVTAWDDPYLKTELATFSTQYGLPAPNAQNFQVVYPEGFQPVVEPVRSTLNTNRNWTVNEAVSVEWMHAMAPAAKIVVVEASSDMFSDLIPSITYAANYVAGSGGVVYMPFAGAEPSDEGIYDSAIFLNPIYNKVTFVAPTGDSPAIQSWPGASPGVVEVGGTTLTPDNLGNRASETVYTSSGGGVSGGGVYSPTYGWVLNPPIEAVPSYQVPLQSNWGTSATTNYPGWTPNATFWDPPPFDGRSGPDVAMNAANMNEFFEVQYASAPNVQGVNGWQSLSSTVNSGAMFAGIVAVINQLRNESHLSPIGSSMLTSLYNVGYYDPNGFYDITLGAESHAFSFTFTPAGATQTVTLSGTLTLTADGGWDMTSGWGVPNVSTLYTDLSDHAVPPPLSSLNLNNISWSGTFYESWNSVTYKGPSWSAFSGNGAMTGTGNLVPVLNTQFAYNTVPANTFPTFQWNQITLDGSAFFGTGLVSNLSSTDLQGIICGVNIDGTLIEDANGNVHLSGEWYTVDSLGNRLGVNNTIPIFQGSFHN